MKRAINLLLVLVLIVGIGLLGKGGLEGYNKAKAAKVTHELSDSISSILEDESIGIDDRLPGNNTKNTEDDENAEKVLEDNNELDNLDGSEVVDEASLGEMESLPVKDEEIKNQEKAISSKIIEASNEQYQSSNIDGFIEIGDGLVREPVIRDPEQYYVRRLPNGEEAFAGTVIAYGEQDDLNKSYSVLYGHGMKNKTRFGYLLDYETMMDDLLVARLFTEESGIRDLELVHFSMIGIDEFENERLTSYPELKHYIDNIEDLGWVFYESEKPLSEDDFVISLSTCATTDATTRIVAIYRER